MAVNSSLVWLVIFSLCAQEICFFGHGLSYVLTNCGGDKMATIMETTWGNKIAAILITTFWNSFSCVKVVALAYIIYRSLFRVYNYHIGRLGSNKDLMPSRKHTFVWTNDGLNYLCIYVSIDICELVKSTAMIMIKVKKTSMTNGRT